MVSDETGTVSSSGDKDTSRTVAGDSAKNLGYRTFLSFDITQLKGTDIIDAKLTFATANVVGDPFSKTTGLGGLHLWRVRGDKGELPDYSTDRDRCVNAPEVMWEPPTVIDVTPEVNSLLLTSKTSYRLQFVASFQHKTNANYVADYINWSLVMLTVTYVEK